MNIKTIQKSTNYIPTAGEKKLLEVILNPVHRNKTITAICKVADISRNVYYDAFQKTVFVDYYNSLCKDLVKQSIGPVINAFIHEAKRGSYTHGKIILEMAGLYTEKKKLDVTTPHKLEDLFPGKKENVNI